MEGYGNENPGAFQPTRPLRGATPLQTYKYRKQQISTHAPLAGRDSRGIVLKSRLEYFNPRAPCGARPPHSLQVSGHGCISTHAPLAGRDAETVSHRYLAYNFNPRAPCGARPPSVTGAINNSIFQPTRPLRGATCGQESSGEGHVISTHAPLAGRDQFSESSRIAVDISTHAPLAGRDSKSVQITMHIFAITDKFQMLLHRMPPVRAFCSFLMQENHADFGCEPPK